jgi:hypothetical protein
MRTIVFTSGILLSLGIILEIVVQTAPWGVPSVTPALLSALAAFSVLFSITLLAMTFLFSLLPKVAHQLKECQH